jgi:sugar lactone lactonase YvrE
MSFRVYPDPPERPLSVAPGATSPPIPIQELVGSDGGDPTIFISIAVHTTPCTPPPPPDPTILLLSNNTQHHVSSIDGIDPTPVAADGAAFASIFPPGPAGRGIYRLHIFKFTPTPINWQIRFHNPDPTTPRNFTWVVADTPTQTRQPWIDLPPSASFQFTPGQPLTQPIRVANLGTGPLTISDPAGSAPGPGFTLAAVPPTISPNACADLQLSFTPTTTAASSSAVYTATSNDTTAQPAPGHNHQTTLTATRKGLAPGTILVANLGTPGEVMQIDPATGERTTLCSGSAFSSAMGVAVEADGSVLVAAQRALVRVDPATGNQTVVASGDSLAGPRGMALEAGGTVLVVAHRALLRIDPATGSILNDIVEMFGATGVAVDADRTILLAGSAPSDDAGELLRINPATGTRTVVASGTLLREPWAVAVEADRHILVTSRRGGLVRVHPVTGEQTVLVAMLFPSGVAVEADGNILLATLLSGANGAVANPSRVIRVDPRTGKQTTLLSFNAPPIRNATAVAVVPGPTTSPHGAP